MIARIFHLSALGQATRLVAGLLLTTAAALGQVTATGQFDPPQLAAGQIGDYVMEVKGANANPAVQLPLVPGLEMSAPYQRSVNANITGMTVVQSLTFKFQVRAGQPGNYTLPQFDIVVDGKKIPVPPATLLVTDKPTAPPGSSRADIVALSATTPRTDIYVGEKFPLDITLAWRDGLQAGNVHDFVQDGDAFERANPSGRPTTSTYVLAGQTYVSNTWHIAISALKSGPQTLRFSMSLEVIIPDRNRPNNDPFLALSRMFGTTGQQQTIKAQSVPLEFNIQSLPEQGRPANFSGGIGLFSIDEPALSSTDLQVGVPVTLKITISGQGNFDRLQAPALDLGALWRTYPPKDAFQARDQVDFRGVKTFEYVLMPMSENITDLSLPDFNFFNPETKSYVDLPLKPIAVKVKPAAPGQAPIPLPAVAAAGPQKAQLVGLHLEPGSWQQPMPRPLLASVYFLGAQAVTAVLFGAFVITRRRQLRLENDPAYARRQRAEREAKAAVERARAAAAAGKAAEFYATAQRALQEAASHDRVNAAEALTWQEFDAHLAARGTPAEIRQQTREIFDAGDALRFGGFSPDQAALAAAAARLDGLVQKLLRRS